MPPTPSETTSYQALLRAVKDELTAGLITVQRALEYQRVKTYWTIGKVIRSGVAASSRSLTLNAALYARISDDIGRQLGLDLTVDTLRRSVQFHKTYPRFPQNTPLTFTHYLALMRVTDPQKRARLEQQAIRDQTSSCELKEAVLRLNAAPAALIGQSPQTLTVARGEPYVYATRPFADLYGRENMCVDCGFKIHVPINGSIIRNRSGLSNGKPRYVRVIKQGREYSVRLAVRKRAMIYTYAARVLRVVDGDTLDALLDVGFGIRLQERLRLRAINAPEIKTRAGLAARDFFTTYLSQCPIVIVRTAKAGMYGRWLADIFSLPQSADPHHIAAEGEYLNQVMLDRGLAGVY